MSDIDELLGDLDTLDNPTLSKRPSTTPVQKDVKFSADTSNRPKSSAASSGFGLTGDDFWGSSDEESGFLNNIRTSLASTAPSNIASTTTSHSNASPVVHKKKEPIQWDDDEDGADILGSLGLNENTSKHKKTSSFDSLSSLSPKPAKTEASVPSSKTTTSGYIASRRPPTGDKKLEIDSESQISGYTPTSRRVKSTGGSVTKRSLNSGESNAPRKDILSDLLADKSPSSNVNESGVASWLGGQKQEKSIDWMQMTQKQSENKRKFSLDSDNILLKSEPTLQLPSQNSKIIPSNIENKSEDKSDRLLKSTSSHDIHDHSPIKNIAPEISITNFETHQAQQVAHAFSKASHVSRRTEEPLMKTFENEQLSHSLELVHQRHKEELTHMENTFKMRTKLLEETYEDRIKRLQESNEDLVKNYSNRAKQWEEERADLVRSHHRRLMELSEDQRAEMGRLQNLQKTMMDELVATHEIEIRRIEDSKQKEIDAISAASLRMKSVNVAVDSIERNSRDIQEINARVDAKNNANIDARLLELKLREQDLKHSEEKAHATMLEAERDRASMQDLIVKLELRLREQQQLSEKDRWKLIQEQNMLSVREKGLISERENLLSKISEERAQLERERRLFYDEQKNSMEQINEERRRLTIERLQVESAQKTYNARERIEAARGAAVEAEIEGSLRAIAREQETLAQSRADLKHESDHLAKMKAEFANEKEEIKIEQTKLASANLELKKLSLELETLKTDSHQKFQEGDRALGTARAIEKEQVSRLEALRNQEVMLRDSERALSDERLALARERKQLQIACSELVCSKCGGKITEIPPESLFQVATRNVSNFIHSDFPRKSIDSKLVDSGYTTPSSRWQPQSEESSNFRQALEIEMLIKDMRNSAEKDEEYLAQESNFLTSLRSSYSSIYD